MSPDQHTPAEQWRNTRRLQRLKALVARRIPSAWGTGHIEKILAQDPCEPHTRCSRYAGILEESGDQTVILAETVEQLARDMGALADADFPLVPIELIDLDSCEQRLACRSTNVTFAPAVAPANMRTFGPPR